MLRGVALCAFGVAAMVSTGTAGRAQMTPPSVHRHLYSETADPTADIAAAMKQAQAEHKRVILDFGGDWCGDCQVLDIYFHEQPNLELLEKNFVMVHVWIGHMDKNIDVAAKYGVPIEARVCRRWRCWMPEGKVLFAQSTGDFSNMRAMDVHSVTEFLNEVEGLGATARMLSDRATAADGLPRVRASG